MASGVRPTPSHLPSSPHPAPAPQCTALDPAAPPPARSPAETSLLPAPDPGRCRRAFRVECTELAELALDIRLLVG